MPKFVCDCRHAKPISYEFAVTTSFHGIPHIGYAKTHRWRIFWVIVFILCCIMLTYQIILMITRYLRYDKIVEIEIKFEKVRFPAVTICNINPYKKSSIEKIGSIKKTMDIYTAAAKRPESEKASSRTKRSKEKPRYEPIFEPCRCLSKHLNERCLRMVMGENDTDDSQYPGYSAKSVCLCFYDTYLKFKWPCYHTGEFVDTECNICSSAGYCVYPGSEKDSFEPKNISCICHRASKLCLLKPGVVLDTTEHLIESMGYDEVEGKAAIQAKAKENLIFAVAELDEETKINISYRPEDTLKACSFSSRDCNIRRDFKTRHDPSFGNCFTFNFKSGSLSTRPGSLYGLRLLVYADKSDYLPTTEASGAKIVIHDHADYPFADAFGYNSPTGFLSSFAVRMQKLVHLPSPYGDCRMNPIENKTAAGYLYDEEYSMEGCHRSCLQKTLVKLCGCADARFPIPTGAKSCPVEDQYRRKCLEAVVQALSGLGETESTIEVDCDECARRCVQTVFSVTFSAAQWPTDAAKTSLCPNASDDCIKRYREHASFIEVYFEQVNYELLRELPAYGWENLLADFGGQLSLWMGVSVITCIEVMVLCYQLCSSYLLGYKEWKDETSESIQRKPSEFRIPEVRRPSPIEEEDDDDDDQDEINRMFPDGTVVIRGKPSSELRRPSVRLDGSFDVDVNVTVPVSLINRKISASPFARPRGASRTQSTIFMP